MVSWFLAFEVSWLLESKKYWLLGLKFLGLVDSEFRGFQSCKNVKFSFLVFRKILLPSPRFSRCYETGRRDFAAPAFSNMSVFKVFRFIKIRGLQCPRVVLDLFRCPVVSKDKSSWFWEPGTRPKIPKS